MCVYICSGFLFFKNKTNSKAYLADNFKHRFKKNKLD